MLSLIILMFCCTGSMGAILPFLQVVLRNMGCSLSIIGLVGSLSDVCSILLPLLIARLADKAGRSKGSLAGSVIAYMALFAPALLSSSIWVSVVCIALATGFSSAVLPMSDSMATGYLKGNSMGYGIVRSFGSAGYIVVCLLLGFTGWPDTSDNKSILLCILLSGAITLLSLFFFPQGYEGRSQTKPVKLSQISSILTKPFLALMAITAIQRFSWTFVDKFSALYLKEELGYGDYYLVLVALGPLLEIVFMLLGGKLLDKGRIHGSSLLLVGCLGIFARYMLYYFCHDSLTGILLAQLMHGISYGAFQMGALKLIATSIEKEHYSLAIGIFYSIGQRIPIVLGSMVGGFIIESSGYSSSLLFFAAFGLASALLTVFLTRALNSKAS